MIYINNYIIKPSPSFEKEFNKIYKHIAFKLKEPITANNFYNKIIKEIHSLQHFPERYMKISSYKNKNKNLRRLIVNQYIIIYEVDNNTRTSFHFTYLS